MLQATDVHAALDAIEAATPAAVDAPATETAVTIKPIDAKAVLSSMGNNPTEETEEEATETPAVAPATTEAKPETTEAAKPVELAPEDAIFSEAALATKEGQDAARKWLADSRADLKAKHAEHSRQTVKQIKREAKNKARAEENRIERDKLIQIGNEQRAAVQGLFSGDAKSIAASLGRITGKNPVEVVKELSMLLASNGKDNGRGDPKVEALEKRIDDLVAAEEARQMQATEREQEAAFERAKDQVLKTAQDTAQYPLLAAYAAASPEQAAEVREELSNLIIAADKAKTPITQAQAARHFELLLEAEKKASPVASVSDAPAAKPAPAPVAKPTQGLTSKDTTAPVKRRPRGEPESVDELAADQSFVRQLGLG